MNIREQMFAEMQDKKLFELAKQYAFDYANKSLERNVFPSKEALQNLSIFDEKIPSKNTNPTEIINQLHNFGSPATISQIGGRYFGLVNGGIIPVALATKWLNDFWDQNTPLYVTSPITSKIESVVEKWLIELMDLPTHTVAGFVSGTSMAILCGIAAGRYRIYKRLGWDINEQGLNGAPKIRVVTSKHTHGTVLKAVALLGLGKNSIEYVDVDKQGRIIIEKIPELDENSILILQAGNVNSGAFDNFETICTKAKKANAWVHIDGAFGLWAAATKSFKHLTRGIEKANSFSMDGHKTLNTPYDNGIILCTDKEALVSALQATGSYIIYSENRDGMLYTPEMSRRARAIELWATLKYLGTEGIDELILGLNQRAKQFKEELKETVGFNVLNDVEFNQVLVKCETDKLTEKVMNKIQELNECWVGGSIWFGQKVIRISVCSWATTKEDVSRSVASFKKAYEILKTGYNKV